MKKLNNALIFLCSLASICIFVKDLNIGATDRFLGDLSMVFVLLIPKIVRWLFKIKITDAMEFVYVIFMISFTLMIASFWEFMEFGSDLIMKTDVQHALDTGVADTMQDMLIAFLGSIIVAVKYVLENKKGLIKKIVSALK